KRESATSSPTVTSTIGGGLDCPVVTIPPRSRRPLLLQLLCAYQMVNGGLVGGADEALAEFLAAKEPRHPCERLEVLAGRTLRADDAEEDGDLGVVDRLELDAARDDEKGRHLLAELRERPVR